MHDTKDALLELCSKEESVIDLAALYALAGDADAEIRLLVAELLAFLKEGAGSPDVSIRRWAAKQLPEP